MIRVAAFIPKVLIALFLLGILYELPWQRADLEIPTKSWLKDTIKEHATLLLGDNTITSITGTRPIKPEKEHTKNASAPTIQHAELEQDEVDDAFAPATQPAEPEQEHDDDGAAPAIDWSKTHVSYGTPQCMPDFEDERKQLALERKKSCAQHAPFPTKESRRVALATISTGERVPAYDGAVQSQMFHAAVHGTSAHVLCDEMAPGAWNKIAYLQHLTLTELLKPKDERLEWIMWIDRDAIILDPCRPLSSFLPPDTPEYAKYNILTNHDFNGLNAGVFIFRVNKWISMFFTAVLAYPLYLPDVNLGFAEQTAMQYVLASDVWKDHEARVPQYWFNTYPDGNQSIPAYMSGAERPNLESWRVRRGDLALHFAGNQERKTLMLEWYDTLAKAGNIWETGVTRDITTEIEQYWARLGDDKKRNELEYAGIRKPALKPKPQPEVKKPTKEEKKPKKEDKEKATEGDEKQPQKEEGKNKPDKDGKESAEAGENNPTEGRKAKGRAERESRE